MKTPLLHCFTLSAFAITLTLCSCGPSPAEKAQMTELAKVKKIAVITLAGKSSANPTSKQARQFTDELLAAFQAAAATSPPTVEFIPLTAVAQNEGYRRVAKIQMPEDVYSPVEGITYLPTGDNEFDFEPLVKGLGVDAVLAVVVDFGIAVRNNGSQHYLTATPICSLNAASGAQLWGRPLSLPEEFILLHPTKHLKLSAGISAKWIVMAGPSAEEQEELMSIAAENKTTLPQKVGTGLVVRIVSDIQKSREFVARDVKR